MVVDLLFGCVGSVFVFVLLCIALFPLKKFNLLEEEEISGCLTDVTVNVL